jgi:hypothetical protein
MATAVRTRSAMKETETVTISHRTWTSHLGSPEGPGSDSDLGTHEGDRRPRVLGWRHRLAESSDGPPSTAGGADVPDLGVRSRAENSASGAQWGAIQAAVVFLAEPADLR